jgi:hypothetical protein
MVFRIMNSIYYYDYILYYDFYFVFSTCISKRSQFLVLVFTIFYFVFCTLIDLVFVSLSLLCVL